MYKPPAFLAHAPLEVTYQRISEALLPLFIDWFEDPSVQVARMLGTGYEPPYGFYSIESQFLSGVHFLKVLPTSFQSTELFSLELERRLADAGVNARKMHMREVSWQNKAFILILSPFYRFQPFELTSENAFKLGQHLGRVHQVLKKDSYQPEAQANWQQKKHSFDTLRNQVASELTVQKRLREIGVSPAQCKLYLEHFHLLDFDLKEAQMVHGDLNSGNVLSHQDTPWIIDFENARYSFFPAEYDLGMLLERIVLNRVDKTAFWHYADPILDGYGKRPDNLVDAMRALSIRSMSLLLENFLVKDLPWNATEWKKFTTHLLQLQAGLPD